MFISSRKNLFLLDKKNLFHTHKKMCLTIGTPACHFNELKMSEIHDISSTISSKCLSSNWVLLKNKKKFLEWNTLQTSTWKKIKWEEKKTIDDDTKKTPCIFAKRKNQWISDRQVLIWKIDASPAPFLLRKASFCESMLVPLRLSCRFFANPHW